MMDDHDDTFMIDECEAICDSCGDVGVDCTTVMNLTQKREQLFCFNCYYELIEAA